MNTYSNQSRSKQCVRFIITPYIYAIRVFAMDFVFPCRCCKNLYNQYRSINLLKIYKLTVEFFVWISAFKFLTLIFYPNSSCGFAIRIYPENPKLMATAFFITSLYVAMQMNIINGRMLSLHLIKSSYDGELEWAEQKKHYMLLFLSIHLMFIITWSVFSTIVIYVKLKDDNDSEIEAMGCTLWVSIWFIYANGQTMSLLASTSILFVIIGRRLIHLSKTLTGKRSGSSSLKIYLDDLIASHLEIWEFFQHISDNLELFIPLLYAYFMNFTGFLLYEILFDKMDVVLRFTMVIMSLLVLLSCIIGAWALSYLTSLLYDNFISIGRFSESNLQLEYKFKVIDFMKRFEGPAIGLSMAGFFTIKKDFVIRMVNGMYSAFSTLIELTGVLSSRKSCPSNRTSINNL